MFFEGTKRANNDPKKVLTLYWYLGRYLYYLLLKNVRPSAICTGISSVEGWYVYFRGSNFNQEICIKLFSVTIGLHKVLTEVKFEERKSALLRKEKTHRKILPFVTQYHPVVPNLKKILMSKWHLIQDQPLLREIQRASRSLVQKR